jgi:hypothetical protein
MKNKVIILFSAVFFVSIFLFPARIYAVTGTIDSANFKSKLLEDSSLINWLTSTGAAVTITDTAVTGEIWGENIGWIRLGPLTNGGVVNNGSGVLSGYAWGEIAGWINFAPTNGGVTINQNGEFAGFAWSENYGWIKFDCSDPDACVKTDWRPPSVGGGGGGHPPPSGYGPQLASSCSISASPSSGIEPLLANFSITENGTDHNKRKMRWGDGSDTGLLDNFSQSLSHTYGQAGSFIATLELIDRSCFLFICSEDVKTTCSQNISVGQALAPPQFFEEICGNGLDDDNDGQTDEDCPLPVPVPAPSPAPSPAPAPVPTPVECLDPETCPLSPPVGLEIVSECIDPAQCPLSPPTGLRIVVGQGPEGLGIFPRIGGIADIITIPLREIFAAPISNAVSKTITTGALILGASVFAVQALFANPLTFSEIFLIPFRIWSAILAFFGLRKRARPWGTVYDAVTKQPLDPAYVILSDLSGKEIASAITDLDGRYGFVAEPGRYRLSAEKTDYTFPSGTLSGKAKDELYDNLYFGEEIIVAKSGEIIAKNIPLEPVKFNWNEFAKNQHRLTRFYSRRDLWIANITSLFFMIGFLISIVALFAAPEPYNLIIFFFYILVLILRQTGMMKPIPKGSVFESSTGDFLPFAIIRVYLASAPDTEVAHKVTDRSGKYYCLVQNGQYIVSVERKNLDGSYTLAHKSSPINVTKGYIDAKLTV